MIEEIHMKQRNIRPIGRREIRKIFTSPEFLQRLKDAADMSWATNGESGFCVARDIDNRIFYGDVIDGEEDSIRQLFTRTIEQLGKDRQQADSEAMIYFQGIKSVMEDEIRGSAPYDPRCSLVWLAPSPCSL